MHENEIAKEVVDIAFHIHQYFGPGMLESAYQAVMVHELNKRGLKVRSEVPVPIVYDGVQLTTGFRADLIVEEKVIVELKSIEVVLNVHKKQLLTYLRLSDKRLGLLINFGEKYFKRAVTRIANDLAEDEAYWQQSSRRRVE